MPDQKTPFSNHWVGGKWSIWKQFVRVLSLKIIFNLKLGIASQYFNVSNAKLMGVPLYD